MRCPVEIAAQIILRPACLKIGRQRRILGATAQMMGKTRSRQRRKKDEDKGQFRKGGVDLAHDALDHMPLFEHEPECSGATKMPGAGQAADPVSPCEDMACMW